MELIPAIDLRQGRVVRLQQGDDRRRRVYDFDPATVLLGYADAGVRRVHVVDLDAALGGEPQRPLLSRLVALPGAPSVQLGGGLRTREGVQWAFDAGFERAVVTSLMVRDFALFEELVTEFPHRLVPALDCAGGVLKSAGWTESGGDLGALTARLRPLAVPAVLVTDIERDGMLRGPNLELAREMALACDAPALLSGGVAALADLEAAACEPAIAGAIVGRALYDGRIELAAALAVCAGPAAEEQR